MTELVAGVTMPVTSRRGDPRAVGDERLADRVARAPRHAFGIADPNFGRDVAYYVFALPAVAARSACSSAWSALALLARAAPTAARRGARTARRRRRASSRPRASTSPSLGAALFLLDAAAHLGSRCPGCAVDHGPLVGASYTRPARPAPRAVLAAAAAVAGARRAAALRRSGGGPGSGARGRRLRAVSLLARGVVPAASSGWW